MKIDYPRIEWEDVRDGDTILRQFGHDEEVGTHYVEFTVSKNDPSSIGDECIHYLIDRPKEKFPEEYGAIIIAKKVRGVEFPDGIALMRHRGSYGHQHTKPQWKSVGTKIKGYDNHGETHIEDWVLGKIVPV